MKLDKIKFAQLVAFIGDMVRRGNVDANDVILLDNMIDIETPEQQAVYPHNGDIERLMFLMLEGKQKIEAIKIHRQLTGFGLKDSKDAVERYWNSTKPLLTENVAEMINDNTHLTPMELAAKIVGMQK